MKVKGLLERLEWSDNYIQKEGSSLDFAKLVCPASVNCTEKLMQWCLRYDRSISRHYIDPVLLFTYV